MNNTNDTPTQVTPAEPNSKRTVLITIVIGLVLIGALWVWKSIDISNLRQQSETERTALKKDATRQLMQAHTDHLKLLAKPLVWALRTEMLQNNLSQVNLYMSDMVKEKNIQRIIIANNKSIVIASTNKKDEGQAFSAVMKDTDQNVDETKIVVSSNTLIMTSPVMGFNNRLGFLFIKYTVPPPEFK